MALFGKKDSPEDRGGSPVEALQEACDRNTPVCVIRPAECGRVPMARGRLLALHPETVDIQELDVPGLDVEFRLNDDLDAYFSLGRTLYHFRTVLLASAERKRLNNRMVIPGMTLRRPGRLEEGDRRGLFRVSLSALDERFLVEAWKVRAPNRAVLDESAWEDLSSDAAGLPPIAFNLTGLDLAGVDADSQRPADFSGWLNDATERGFNLRLEYAPPSRFTIFEPLLIRVTLPGGVGMQRYLCEVRSRRAVGDDGARLGVVVIDEADKAGQRAKASALRALLTTVQREQIRRARKQAG